MSTSSSSPEPTLTFVPELISGLDFTRWDGRTSNKNPDVNVVILSGAGVHFCAGIDL
jgi:hypothetical protein